MGFSALREGSESRRVYSPVWEIRWYEKTVFQSHLECTERAHRPQEVPLHKNHALKVQTDRVDRVRFTRAWLKAPLRSRR